MSAGWWATNGANSGNASISNSYATGNVTGTNGDVGGLVGYNQNGNAGTNSGTASISNSYATGNVTGNNIVGGLVGSNQNGSISNSYATGSVTGSNDNVGGLVGIVSYGGSISNSYATGSVTGNNYVGGLVGNNPSSSISNSYATGNVTGNNYVGGLVGYGSGSISNSYATGSVTGTSDVGGLVGYNYGSISNSYATGSVTGTSDVGGLAGFNGASISNSFWDKQTSNQQTSASGTGLTTAGMKSLSTFSNVGWSIDDTGGTSAVWRIYDGDTYPLLRSFLTTASVSTTKVGGSIAYDGTAFSSNGGNHIFYIGTAVGAINPGSIP